MKNEVELGDEVACKITGYKGVVTAYAKMLTGCDRVIVQPPIDKDGKMVDSTWIDVASVEVIKKRKVKNKDVQGEKKGGWPTKGKP